MPFLDSILSPKTKQVRQELIKHAFWKRIEDGSLSKKALQIFAQQDYWLVKQATRIDTLIIASMQDEFLRDLLLERLAARFYRHPELVSGSSQEEKKMPKRVRHDKGNSLLLGFAEGVGLTKKNLENAEPLAGCMALTTYFYWMIDNTSDLEKITCIDASKEIFSLLCVRVQPALIKHYKLSQKQAMFFTVHEGVLARLKPVDEYIEKQAKTKEQKNKIDLAARLSYEFEIMFYDTALSV